MTSLVEFAEAELRALPGKRDAERTMLERDVIGIVALFQAQRHSGSSAKFVARALTRLLWWQSLAVTDEELEQGRILAVQAITDSALIERLTAMHAAVEEAANWHDRQAKALGKQPPGGDLAWRRNEHREQAEALRSTLTRSTPDAT